MNNNYIISIPKNLKEIEAKLFFGLTKRQLVGFSIGGILGILTFLLFKNFSLDLAMYSLFFVVAPIIFITIYKKDGMYIEKWIKLLIEQKYLNPQKRTYNLSKRNYALAKERRTYKNEKYFKSRSKPNRTKKNEFISSVTTTNK